MTLAAPDRRTEALDDLVARGETGAALALALELIGAYAAVQDFASAERLRDRIYDIDPLALGEILKAGEIIDGAKSRGLDAGKLAPLGALTAGLSSAETHALYYALQERRLSPGEVLFRQGDLLQQLFFVQQGRLRLLCRQREGEREIAILEPGDIAGEETFFGVTLSTVSLAAVSDATLAGLPKKILEQWDSAHPALKGKLQLYCQQRRKRFEPQDPGQAGRRFDTRSPLGGSVVFQLLGPEGQPLGKPLRGEMADISRSGVSFFIKTAMPRNAELLLGRRLGLQFSRGAPSPHGRAIRASGRVVAVQHQMFNDYSVHLRLDAPLDEPLPLGKTAAANPPKAGA